jgi:hypothetical protein
MGSYWLVWKDPFKKLTKITLFPNFLIKRAWSHKSSWCRIFFYERYPILSHFLALRTPIEDSSPRHRQNCNLYWKSHRSTLRRNFEKMRPLSPSPTKPIPYIPLVFNSQLLFPSALFQFPHKITAFFQGENL